MKHRVALVCALVTLAGRAGAQEAPEPPPAKGPADLINRAREEASKRSLARAPATTQPPPSSPHAANPHAAPVPVSSEQPNPALAVGSIRVRVVDEHEAPVAGIEVRIGVLHSDAKRSEHLSRTGADGTALVTGLAVGSQQAYRASVDFERARYGSNPFRLGEEGGYDVVLHRLPVTEDDARIVLYLGATSIELKDERVSIVQHARLLNLDPRTYVFPEGGKLVRLPRGFTAFQVQESMGDQRAREAPEEGVRIEGSIPPGEATIVWGFDLPITGPELEIATEVPWKTFAYRVIADAAPGLRLEVDGMPAPMLHEDGGRRFFVTELQRRIGDDPFLALRIRLDGIPGPGPLRWIAAGLALVAIGIGVVVSRRPRRARLSPAAAPATRAARQALLERAADLDASRERGEIGPRYHEEESQMLVDELAALLWEEAETGAASERK